MAQSWLTTRRCKRPCDAGQQPRSRGRRGRARQANGPRVGSVQAWRCQGEKTANLFMLRLMMRISERVESAVLDAAANRPDALAGRLFAPTWRPLLLAD